MNADRREDRRCERGARSREREDEDRQRDRDRDKDAPRRDSRSRSRRRWIITPAETTSSITSIAANVLGDVLKPTSSPASAFFLNCDSVNEPGSQPR